MEKVAIVDRVQDGTPHTGHDGLLGIIGGGVCPHHQREEYHLNAYGKGVQAIGDVGCGPILFDVDSTAFEPAEDETLVPGQGNDEADAKELSEGSPARELFFGEVIEYEGLLQDR